jgi:hypothetical protein
MISPYDRRVNAPREEVAMPTRNEIATYIPRGGLTVGEQRSARARAGLRRLSGTLLPTSTAAKHPAEAVIVWTRRPPYAKWIPRQLDAQAPSERRRENYSRYRTS